MGKSGTSKVRHNGQNGGDEIYATAARNGVRGGKDRPDTSRHPEDGFPFPRSDRCHHDPRLPAFPVPPRAVTATPSAAAMKPCARLSGLCGLSALVAGLVAISFLATHASAAADPCANEDCGEATCTVDVGDTPVCNCKDGFVFDSDNKRCLVDPCTGVECGLQAHCLTLTPTEFVCDCKKQGFYFNEADKTCFAPMVRTTVAVQASGNTFVGQRDATFLTQVPAEQASGSSACSNLYIVLKGDTNITVVWNTKRAAPGSLALGNAMCKSVSLPLGSAMCKSVSFYADWDCKAKLDFTIARPAKKGSSYPVTKRTVNGVASLLSVGCDITMCENDCGAAECVVKKGKPLCQCPEGLLFNAAKKLCLVPPPRAGGQAKNGRH
ncbi:unnamed protein product [Closterium sp. Yama58-4]|nr:unnamed protein product [Closterium sp. Yama58-4]